MRLTSETSTIDVLDLPVRDKEAFLPPHKDDAPFLAMAVVDSQARTAEFVLECAEGGEAAPVCHVLRLRRTIVVVGGQETELFADDLGIEIRGEFGIVVGKALDAEVAAEKRRIKVHVLCKTR